MSSNEGNITIEDARILWPNFEGREGKYNRAGDRNFNVELPEDIAQQLLEDGWNVKTGELTEDGIVRTRHVLQVSIKFDKGKPPRIVMITHRGRTTLDEETVELLDDLKYKLVDMIIRPYEWSVNGNGGTKAYLKTMFITIDEDELEIKYADVPAS